MPPFLREDNSHTAQIDHGNAHKCALSLYTCRSYRLMDTFYPSPIFTIGRDSPAPRQHWVGRSGDDRMAGNRALHQPTFDLHRRSMASHSVTVRNRCSRSDMRPQHRTVWHIQFARACTDLHLWGHTEQAPSNKRLVLDRCHTRPEDFHRDCTGTGHPNCTHRPVLCSFRAHQGPKPLRILYPCPRLIQRKCGYPRPHRHLACPPHHMQPPMAPARPVSDGSGKWCSQGLQL
jgi:hypothetical protein